MRVKRFVDPVGFLESAECLLLADDPFQGLELDAELSRVATETVDIRAILATRHAQRAAVAAMAVAAVGLGSILASSEVRNRSVERIQSASGPVVDTMNVSTNVARANLRAKVARPARTPHRSLRGGPVLREP